jgi:hypothetical protein
MGSQWELVAISAAVLADRVVTEVGEVREVTVIGIEGRFLRHWWFGFQQIIYDLSGIPCHRYSLRWTVISRIMKVDSNLPLSTLCCHLSGNKSDEAPNQSRWRKKSALAYCAPVPHYSS